MGRTGVVVGLQNYQFSREPGPRLLVRVEYDTVEKWDSNGRNEIFTALCQVELIEDVAEAA